MIAPASVHRHARFPGAIAFLRLYSLFRRREVALQLVSVVDNDVRLQAEDHLIHLLRLPARSLERPRNVVPEDVYFSVVGHQLANVRVNVFNEAFQRGFVLGVSRTYSMMPSLA